MWKNLNFIIFLEKKTTTTGQCGLLSYSKVDSLNGFESTLDKELFKGGFFSVRGSWARDWGLGALCSPRTELMGTFPPALECMFTNGSPQMLSQAFTPFPVLPLNPELAPSQNTQTQPAGTLGA